MKNGKENSPRDFCGQSIMALLCVVRIAHKSYCLRGTAADPPVE
ncbi:MAG: hypothetical protein OJF51_001429 [Nitrospira sp.]|nr:MAG: hypothetical protein OJF51_001429 [Nitrospira sp.]